MSEDKDRAASKMKTKEFTPPDGGWGWVVVFAAGFSNLCTFPVLQQFGLLFRDKFARLAINNSQTSTIININSATTAFVGLLNGPMFRKFSYRQVSFFGASVVFVALIFTTFSNSFSTYLTSFSILYGAGVGITASANALALNTFFKKRRRIAAGLSWTTTGLGPIFWPIVITALSEAFGELGAVLILTGLSLHAVAFALLLQPVQWHTRKHKEIKEDEIPLSIEGAQKKEHDSGYFSKNSKFRNVSAFSSQYIYKEDDPVHTGYEIIDPGTPMLSKGNDGYFSTSKRSLNRITSKENSVGNSQLNLTFSKKPSFSNESRSRKSSAAHLTDSKKNSSANLGFTTQESYKGKRKVSVANLIPESEIEDCPTFKAPQDLKAEDKVVVENVDSNKAKIIAETAKKHYENTSYRKILKSEEDSKENRYIRDNRSNMSLKNPEEYGFHGDDRKYFRDSHSNPSLKNVYRRKSNNFNYENEVLKLASLKLEQYILEKTEPQNLNSNGSMCEENKVDDNVFDDKETEQNEKLSFCQKVAIFFDLDLLQDLTYVNLMIGITIANFNELNFSILTPFILGDYGMTKPQVALFMSLLAGIDICVRFCIPFIAGKIGWDNSSFFLFGVMCMAMGRVVLAHCQLYGVTLMVAVMIGFGKGLRTVFMALVIPTHVPLHKLPGATGLQLVTSGFVFLTVGPIVGWIKDNTNNMVTLHCLNIFTYITAIAWGYEKYKATKIAQPST